MEGYVIERQKFDRNGHLEHPEWGGKARHAGYLQVWFRTKAEAFEYYNRSFPNARPLTLANRGHSALHADGYLYIVRTSGQEYKEVPPFDAREVPQFTIEANGSLRTVYPRYRVLVGVPERLVL